MWVLNTPREATYEQLLIRRNFKNPLIQNIQYMTIATRSTRLPGLEWLIFGGRLVNILSKNYYYRIISRGPILLDQMD